MKLSKKSGLHRWVAFLLTLCLIFSCVPAGLAVEEDRQPMPDEQALPTESPAGGEGEDSVPLLPPEDEKPDSAEEPEESEEAAAAVEPPLTEEPEKELSMPETEGEEQIEKGASPLPEGAGVESEGEAEQAQALLTVDSDEMEVARRALGEQIARVTGDKATDWYQTDDRFNGKESSGQGFWTDLQPILAAARELYENPRAVDAALLAMAAELNTAIDNLIPVDCVNATALYEAVQECSGHVSFVYTAATWAVFSERLKMAKSLLAILFDEEGKPSAENTAAKQLQLDVAVSNLREADNNLLTNAAQTEFDHYSKVYRRTAQWLQGLNDLCEDDYTPESWSNWTAARQELDSCVSAGCGSTKKIQAYIEAISTAGTAYYCLEAKQESITVHVRVADSFSLIRPSYALSDAKTRTYDGTVVLTGDKTVGGLMNAISFSKNQVERSPLYSPTFAVYINGILAVNRQNKTIPQWNINTDGIPQLHDGDEVVIAVSDPPAYWYYVNYNAGASYDGVYSFVSLLNIESAEEVIEVEAGQPFELTVSKTTAAAESIPSVTVASGADVFLSMVQQTEDEARNVVANQALGIQTNSSGKAVVTCYAEGWYRLAVADITPQTAGSINEDGYISGGKYDNLAVNDYVLLHVLPAEDDSPIRDALQQELDEQYASYDKGFFTDAQWQKFDGLYRKGSSAIADSPLLGSAYSAQAEALSAMGSLVKKIVDEHKVQKLDIEWFMSRLPDRAEDFTACFTEKFERLKTLIEELSPYMLGQLTQGQKAKYDLLLDTYTGYQGKLPEAKTYRVSLVAEGADNMLYSGYVQTKVDYRMQSYRAPSSTISDSLGFSADGMIPGEMFSFTVYDPTVSLGSDWPELQVIGITIEGVEDWISYSYDDFRQDIFNENRFYNTGSAFVMPSSDVTIHVRVGAVPPLNADISAPAELVTLQTAALARLNDLFATYGQTDYSQRTWEQLLAAKKAGEAAIRAADNETALAAALQDALDSVRLVGQRELENLPEDFGDLVGRVYVSVENTTYPEGNEPFEYFIEMADENVFLAGWYDLYEMDNMMTVILRAMKSSGLSWTGTGGDKDDPYSITYLSAVYYDENGNGIPDKDEPYLAEFTGGPDSGWMGTLNDWFTNYGFQMFTVQDGKLVDGDVINVQYTTNLGVDISCDFNHNNTQLGNLEIEGGIMSPAFDKDTYCYMLMVPNEGALVKVAPKAENKVFLVKTFLNYYDVDSSFYSRNQSIPVSAGDTLYVGCGEYAWPSMNKAGLYYDGAKYTIHVVSSEWMAIDKKTEELPQAKDVSYKNYAKYQMAVLELYSAYSVLTAEDQKNVTNGDKLFALKAKVNRYAAVDEVKAAMAALPTREDWTDGDKPALQALLDAYRALPEADRLDCMTVSEGELAAAMEEYLAPILYGDANGDGKVNSKDATRILRYSAGYHVEIDVKAADANGDGKVNSKDATRVLRYSAGYDVVLGPNR